MDFQIEVIESHSMSKALTKEQRDIVEEFLAEAGATLKDDDGDEVNPD